MYVCFKTIALPLQNSEDKGCGRSSEYFRIDRPTRLVKMGLSAAAEVHFDLEDAQQVGGRFFWTTRRDVPIQYGQIGLQRACAHKGDEA